MLCWQSMFDEKKAEKVEKDAVEADLKQVEITRYESGRGPRSSIDAEGYTVGFVPKQRWRVVDKEGQVISKGNETRADAEAALAQHKAEKARQPVEPVEAPVVAKRAVPA